MARKKRVKFQNGIKDKKQPHFDNSVESWLSREPSWRFSRMDKESDRWSPIGGNGCLEDIILRSLSAYEGMTWAEIQQASGGRAHGTNNHYENISDMIKDAQKRAEELNIYDDELFSLRIGGTRRVYGILENSVFSIIWYDRNHEIYPVSD